MTILRRLLFWAVAVVFPLPLVVVYDTTADDPVGLKQLVLFGLIAYSWWLLSILLSVRPRWLDRFVGLPAIYGFHGMLGVLALALAYLHAENSYTSNRLARVLGDWGLYGAIGTLCLAVFFLSGWLVDRSQILLRLKRLLERVLRHQRSVWIHRLNFVILLMIWLHAHVITRVNQYFAFMTLLDLYTVTVLGIYAWKKWIAPNTYLTGTVLANEARGGTTRRIAVELDHAAADLRPGDFFFLSFGGSSAVGREWHPFSVTDDDRRTLTFTIRQHGDYTRRIEELEPGTRTRLEGPFGRFESIVRKQDPDTQLVFLGMGAGVAPLLSLVAAHHTSRRIHILWAVRAPEDAYYRDELSEYADASGGRLRVTVSVGRFRREQLTALLSAETTGQGAFFIVGPNGAVLASQRLLRRIGVSPARIHQERLTM